MLHFIIIFCYNIKSVKNKKMKRGKNEKLCKKLKFNNNFKSFFHSCFIFYLVRTFGSLFFFAKKKGVIHGRV